MQENREIQRTTREQSQFISAARFLMICGLVFHHLFEIPGSFNSPRLNLSNHVHLIPEFINAFFHIAFMAAVPLLSVITGYLFFRGGEVDFTRQLKKRFFSVALPAWLWCGLWLALAYAIYRFAGGAAPFAWANYGFAEFTAFDLLNGVFAVTAPPFAFQFWFVRDLILTLLLSPLIYLLLRRFGGLLLLPGFALWFLLPDYPIFFSANVPMFFTVGAWLALPGGPGLHESLQRLRGLAWLLLPLFVLALAARVMSQLFGPLEATLGSEYYLRMLRLLGVLSFALLIFEAVRRNNAAGRLLVRFGPYSFFVFAAHFPVIELLQIPVVWIPGHASALGMFLSWLCIPLLTITLVILGACLLEQGLPAVFGLLNGGRSLGASERKSGAQVSGREDGAPAAIPSPLH